MKSVKPKKNLKTGKLKKAVRLTKVSKRRRRAAERIVKIKFLSLDELRRLMAVIERSAIKPCAYRKSHLTFRRLRLQDLHPDTTH